MNTVRTRHQSEKTPNQTRLFSTERLVIAGLLLLAFVPVLAGSVRLVELGSGAEVTADNARFFGSPIPVVIHIISVSFYAVLGAFQLAPRFRVHHPRWHRNIGRFLVPIGLAAALSGLWMTNFYALPAYDGEILYVERLIVGAWMVLSLCLGYVAMRRHKYAQHGAWMLRAYAIGMGAGTQVFTHIPWVILWGQPSAGPRAVLMGMGWAINFILAEWVIRQRLTRPARRVKRAVASTV